ncbi:hypothetical protein [Streptomyces sp. NPDC097619]|uniref:hypothetical protein n=1 Tax=Streptomyces sp. NPDC097619 TaxID=3157228 RepID=UPI0033164CBB
MRGDPQEWAFGLVEELRGGSPEEVRAAAERGSVVSSAELTWGAVTVLTSLADEDIARAVAGLGTAEGDGLFASLMGRLALSGLAPAAELAALADLAGEEEPVRAYIRFRLRVLRDHAAATR